MAQLQGYKLEEHQARAQVCLLTLAEVGVISKGNLGGHIAHMANYRPRLMFRWTQNTGHELHK